MSKSEIKKIIFSGSVEELKKINPEELSGALRAQYFKRIHGGS